MTPTKILKTKVKNYCYSGNFEKLVDLLYLTLLKWKINTNFKNMFGNVRRYAEHVAWYIIEKIKTSNMLMNSRWGHKEQWLFVAVNYMNPKSKKDVYGLLN